MVSRIERFLHDFDQWQPRIFFLAGPFISFLMVETFNENDVFSSLSPLQVFLNLIWYFILFILVRILAGNNRRAAIISISICFLIGLLDHYVLRIRGRALWPSDLLSWQTALNVALSQNYSIDIYIVLAALVFALYIFLILMCPSQKDGEYRLKKRSIVISLAAIFAYVIVFFHTGLMPALGMYTHQWDTRKNGFALNFTLAARNMSFEPPDGYDRNRILELANEYPGEDGDPTKQPENIIVIMNESFADFSIYDRFSSDRDPLPYLHSLQEAPNTISGTLYSSAWRGGTANVEHAFLTGLSSHFQPFVSVAYQLFVKDNTPSMADQAKAAGYETIAFHPYLSSGWNRVQVYSDMGFDQQLYQEDVNDPMYIRDFISDRSDYETVMKLTEANDGKTFIFNVTIQNHNGYAQNWTNLDHTITLPDKLNEIDPEAEQYFAALNASDTALKELISYYQASDEPTMIVFFGDHQPPLATELYEYLAESPLNKVSADVQAKLYSVPFFIWANYDIGSKTDVKTTPESLGSLLSQIAGLPMTGLQQFVLSISDSTPVLFSGGLIRADGTIISSFEDMTEREAQWYKDYEMLVYAGLLDQIKGSEPLFHTEQEAPS